MARLKVISKRDILNGLQKGQRIAYDTLAGKTYLLDSEGNREGAIRFETYLNMLGMLEETNNKYYSHITYRKLKQEYMF